MNTQAGNGLVLFQDTGSTFNADFANNFIVPPGGRIAPTPEGSSLILLGIGLLTFAALAARKKGKKFFSWLAAVIDRKPFISGRNVEGILL